MEKPNILLVEDDNEIRELIKLYMETNQIRVWEAEELKEARAILDTRQPDLLILDLLLPDGSGYDLCQELREKGNDLPVLFLSCKIDSQDIIKGLELGGDDYVTKPFDPNVLVSRVKAHLRRQERQPKQDRNEAAAGREPLVERLTKRELEILALIEAGHTNQEIAAYYNISLGTVKGHNNQLFGKLGARNRTHAILLAREYGLL